MITLAKMISGDMVPATSSARRTGNEILRTRWPRKVFAKTLAKHCCDHKIDRAERLSFSEHLRAAMIPPSSAGAPAAVDHRNQKIDIPTSTVEYVICSASAS